MTVEEWNQERKALVVWGWQGESRGGDIYKREIVKRDRKKNTAFVLKIKNL